MSLQTSLHRRKFLERSALGAGGLLFSSLLLESCTDHRIPTPLTDPPILFEPGIDWNDDAKIVVTTALEMVPEVGDILGGLVDLFWPSTKEDVWGQVKAQVEELVDQKIDSAKYLQVSEDLQGLNNDMILYLHEVQNGTPDDIKTQWIVTRNSFAEAQPHFQSEGNELPLLGLFGQFANMYLALLRDGVHFGQGWGRSDADHQQDILDLKTSITSFSNYTWNTYTTGRSALQQKTTVQYDICEPFKTLNAYDRQMQLKALDFMDTWSYFDITVFPDYLHNRRTVKLSREIYSDPIGASNDDIVVSSSPPTEFPTNITVWGENGGLSWDLIRGVTVTYPENGGPDGITQTPRMGDVGGGSTDSPEGGIYGLSIFKWVTAARAISDGEYVLSMQFLFNDGTSTPLMGAGPNNGFDSGMVGYANEILSSINMKGDNGRVYVTFGFQYWRSPIAQLNAVSTIYVKSPKERSAVDFIKAFPNLSIPANFISEELKVTRKAYWDAIKARAEAQKRA